MTTTASNQEIGTPAPGWGLLLIEGIVILVLGLVLFLAPAMTLFVLIQIVAIYYWLVTGILSIASIFVDSRMWFLKLLVGLLGIAAGIIVNQHPMWSSLLVPSALTLILGIIGIGIGVLHLVRVSRGAAGIPWGAAALGVLNLGLGILILMMPLLTTLTLIYAIATLMVLMGILTIVAAFMARSAQKKQVALRRT